MRVPAKADKQRVLVAKRDPARERMDLHPGLERLLHGFRNGDLTLAAALAAHKQAEVPGVGTWSPQVAGSQTA